VKATRVYVLGTLRPGFGMAAVIAHASTPDRYAWGLPNDPQQAVITPDGRLVYLDPFAPRAFVEDPAGNGDPPYPDDPKANDPDITPAGACAQYRAGMIPAEDGLWMPCSGSSTWVHEDGTTLEATAPYTTLIAARADAVLIAGPLPDAVIRRPRSGLADTLVTGLPDEAGARIVHGRVDDTSGFLLALVRADGSLQRWSVNRDGEARQGAIYRDLPADLDEVTPLRLDGEGRLYVRAQAGGPDAEVVLRRATNEDPVIVFDERTDPRAKSHGSVLVTGP